MRYRELISEAPKGGVLQQVTSFANLLSRYIKEPLYPYGGKGYAEQLKDGFGYLYLTKSGPAFRLNYSGGKISSITVWKKQFNFRPGDFTIDFSGGNILDFGKKLIDIIMNPKPGEYPIAVSESGYLDEDDEFGDFGSDRKRQAKPEEFLSLAMQNLEPGQNIQSLSADDVRGLAHRANVRVPGTAWRTKIEGTKGKNARFDLSKIIDAADKKAEEENVDLYVKVTARDPQTNKFLSVRDSKKAQELTQQVKNMIQKSGPGTPQGEEDVNNLFKKMESLVQLVAMGNVKALLIYGGPGTGKTFTVKQALNSAGRKEGESWFMVKGKITTAQLYRNLFLHRHPGEILVFDDTDSVWNDKEAGNILKAALDSYDERLVSWHSDKTQNVTKYSQDQREEYFKDLDDQLTGGIEDGKKMMKFPSEFIYEGRIIFISNLTRDKFDDAVMTRSAKIDMSLTPYQMFDRMESILPHIGRKDVSIEEKQYIMDFLKDEHSSGRMPAVSLRSFVNAENVKSSGLENWRELLDHM